MGLKDKLANSYETAKELAESAKEYTGTVDYLNENLGKHLESETAGSVAA